MKLPAFDSEDSAQLLQRIEQLEEDLQIVKGERIRPLASTSRGLIGRGGSAPTVASGGGSSSADILQIIVRAYIPQERITSTGTSHSLTYPPGIDSDGNPLVSLSLNGTEMFRGGTGNLGWSFASPNTITTIRSMAAADFLWATYIKKTV